MEDLESSLHAFSLVDLTSVRSNQADEADSECWNVIPKTKMVHKALKDQNTSTICSNWLR